MDIIVITNTNAEDLKFIFLISSPINVGKKLLFLPI